MPRDHGEAQALEECAQRLRIRGCVLDELETVGSHRIFEELGHGGSPARE